MSTTPSQLDRPLFEAAPSIVDRYARKAVLAQMANMTSGSLLIREGARVTAFGNRSAPTDLQAVVQVHDCAFFTAIALGGSVGAAESYARGEWSADDLTCVVRLLIQNREVLERMETGLARVAAPLRHALHWLNRNTRSGSRRNIQAHYDLGNDFFAQFLDESMTYSSAIFESEGASLHDAQLAKIERACVKLDLQPSDHLLEIGSGWGALAMHAARKYGCRVTTVTLSPAQLSLARERIAAAGLSDRIQVLLADYRDLGGHYDKIVSIEMIEAIGHRQYAAYFAKASQLLRPQGMMLVQAITIADHLFAEAARSVDFIQRYIFPGSALPCVSALCEAVMRASDLRLFNLEDIGPHYARTLRMWRERFQSRRQDLRALGRTEEFCRLWEYYFSYCEGGFEERVLGDVQMLLVKPGNRRSPILTPLADI